MIQKILALLLGSQQKRDLKRLIPLVKKINSYEPAVMKMKKEEFRQKTLEFKERYKKGESLDAFLPEAFALVREAAYRMLGERLFDVQLMGGIALHQGNIMEMKTGEGKTVSSVPAAYLNSLTGKGVHIVTVNDYLAKRDTEWMGPVYDYMGVTVGTILSEMDVDARKEEYAKDITYGTNNEFGFDYLRDNLKWEIEKKTQRGHHYCIIDEIDSILIDEARTPLIISGPAEDDANHYYDVNKLVDNLTECEKDPQTGEYPENPAGDYKIEEKNKRVTFTDEGMNHIEKLLLSRGLISGSLFSSENFEFIHNFTQCLKAHKLFHKDVEYIVKDNKVQIVDEFTGRVLYGRRYSDGLHQAIEAKERIKIEQRNRTLATITFQNYFRMYDKIAGMTATADTEAKEFSKIYDLNVVVIPTNRPMVRQDNDDIIYLNESEKFTAICDDIQERNEKGQPVLMGTVSIETSERLSGYLTRRGIKHEVLNAKNHAREALIIAEAGAKGSVTIATNMAGRGTDIKLGGNPIFRARKRAGTDAPQEEYQKAYEIEYEKWKDHSKEICDIGGLYVLGTERHESRRIDNQLRGRSGRQGDPGESSFYISLDDTLMRLFGGENLKGIMSRVGMQEGDPIKHPWINKSIERAQKRVEDRNFEARKHLLEFDDVLNEQRKYIYSRRDEILQNDHLLSRVEQTMEEILSDLLEQYNTSKDTREEALSMLLTGLKENFFFIPALSFEELPHVPVHELEQMLLEELKAELKKKEQELGSTNLNFFLRGEYLRNIDLKWQDHLENLDALREAVYLRAYSQKNPLLEYKLEGFHIFDEMLINIRYAIAKKLFKVQIQPLYGRNFVLERTTTGNATHRVLGQFASNSLTSSSSGGERKEASPVNVQVKRKGVKVGRNDPCPCGSGKKYKRCCGK
ncbi:MAG: preprotein translocase subunit SecA [Spirochaetales bacterium]|nr:preprotein translocase subunit SecA [Spirochaetales bacterium]